MRRLSLRDHLDEVIGDADLREHVEREAVDMVVPPAPPADSIPADLASAPPGPPFAASLTGAVTPLSEARVLQPQPPIAPAPIESTIGGGPQTFSHSSPPAADNAPAMATEAAAAPLPGDGHPAPHLARRRRRSASPLPPLPSPMDVPDDAAGRVTFVALAVAPDFMPASPAMAEDATHATAPPRPTFASPLDEWLPVVVLALVMLLVFIVGVVVTH